MSKGLPYFKFEPNKWISGDITLCSLAAQGLFINVCVMYWSRKGQLELSKAKKRFKSRLWSELLNDEILTVDNGFLVIDFLDKQLAERGAIAERNRVNGAKGGRKKKNPKKTQSVSKKNPEDCNIEENRIEENRIEENRTNSKKSINDFSDEVLSCYKQCLNFFPERLRPEIRSEELKWLDVVDKLNRIDGIPFDVIEKIVKFARDDDFWSKNFLSLTKLRKKDRDGLKYIKVFYEKFKSKFTSETGGASQSLRDKTAKDLGIL